MKEIFQITSIVLYLMVGVISMKMAFKNLFSSKLIKFHQKASGTSWEELDKPLQLVILSLMRVAGMGFLVIALLLFIFPLINYFSPNKFIQYIIPIIAAIYSLGLFIINYYLYKRTNVTTPWKGSVIAVIVIIIAVIISGI